MQGILNNAEMHSVMEMLARIRGKGVHLWVDGGSLRYQAPLNTLNPSEVGILRRYRQQIIRLLDAGHEELIKEVPPGRSRAPLSYSQLQHLNFYGLAERPGHRHLVSVMRLDGRLDVDCLRRSVALSVARHDALRTRIVMCNGIPIQEIDASSRFELRVEDQTELSLSVRKTQIRRSIERIVMQPVYLATEPLFDVCLLRFNQDDHVLVVAMEHIISDMWSINLFVREIVDTYHQLREGMTPQLAPVPIQFPEYARRQRAEQGVFINQHGSDWSERLCGRGRTSFRADVNQAPTHGAGWQLVPIQLDGKLNLALREWCRSHHTTLVMSVFAAWVAASLHWCRITDAVVRFEGNGRVSAELENTIGYFTAPLFLHMQLGKEDRFVDLLNQVSREYLHAYEHCDHSYLEAQLPRPEFTRNPAFNWIPMASRLESATRNGAEGAIRCSAETFDNPIMAGLVRDTEPFAMFVEGTDRIEGGMWFPMNRFSLGTMQRFGRHFLDFISMMIRQPLGRISDVPLVQ